MYIYIYTNNKSFTHILLSYIKYHEDGIQYANTLARVHRRRLAMHQLRKWLYTFISFEVSLLIFVFFAWAVNVLAYVPRRILQRQHNCFGTRVSAFFLVLCLASYFLKPDAAINP